MNKSTEIEIIINTQAIGNVYLKIPYNKNEEGNKFTLDIPNDHFVNTKYTTLDLSYVVEDDIERFKKLNELNDENHQIYIDTLCIFGIKITGNHLRILYWFHQDGDENSHRMCAGQFNPCNGPIEYVDFCHKKKVVYPDCYSSDACVYW